MKASEIREMKVEDLQHELVRLERHLFDLRAQAVTEKLADPTQLGKTRRDIARILTQIRQREIAGGAPIALARAGRPAVMPAKAQPDRPAAKASPAKASAKSAEKKDAKPAAKAAGGKAKKK
ncbi:MAG: 50S ribosomal protein L29 [Phycisphaerae bacterium]